MKSTRLLLAVVAGCCLTLSSLSRAADAVPFPISNQFSAEMVITTKDGREITSKMFKDNDKVRNEMNMQGMQIISIVRPDQKKVYSIMPGQKMVMEMPYDSDKLKQQMPPMSGEEGKFETVGPDAVGAIACTKYKMTNKEGKVFFLWVDTSKQVPVKMASEDGSFSATWKNYQAGPQAASLFEVPAGYQVMKMDGIPGGMPGKPGKPGDMPTLPGGAAPDAQ